MSEFNDRLWILPFPSNWRCRRQPNKTGRGAKKEPARSTKIRSSIMVDHWTKGEREGMNEIRDFSKGELKRALNSFHQWRVLRNTSSEIWSSLREGEASFCRKGEGYKVPQIVGRPKWMNPQWGYWWGPTGWRQMRPFAARSGYNSRKRELTAETKPRKPLTDFSAFPGKMLETYATPNKVMYVPPFRANPLH